MESASSYLPVVLLMAGKGGAMSLIEYGIQTEQSDMRAHVSPFNAMVYLFPTHCGVLAIKNRPQKSNAHTGQMVTAKGYPVPIKEIQNIKPIPIPQDILESAKFSEDDASSVKGNKAVFVVKEMLE